MAPAVTASFWSLANSTALHGISLVPRSSHNFPKRWMYLLLTVGACARVTVVILCVCLLSMLLYTKLAATYLICESKVWCYNKCMNCELSLNCFAARQFGIIKFADHRLSFLTFPHMKVQGSRSGKRHGVQIKNYDSCCQQ